MPSFSRMNQRQPLIYDTAMSPNIESFGSVMLYWNSIFHTIKTVNREVSKLLWRFFEIFLTCQMLFPADLGQLLSKYPITNQDDRANRRQNNDSRDYLYAAILFRLAEAIDEVSSTRSYDVERHRAASNRSEQILSSNIPNIKIPAYNDTVIQYPKLGPLQKFKEDELERYSRTNSILKSLQCVLAPTKWRKHSSRQKAHHTHPL